MFSVFLGIMFLCFYSQQKNIHANLAPWSTTVDGCVWRFYPTSSAVKRVQQTGARPSHLVAPSSEEEVVPSLALAVAADANTSWGLRNSSKETNQHLYIVDFSSPNWYVLLLVVLPATEQPSCCTVAGCSSFALLSAAHTQLSLILPILSEHIRKIHGLVWDFGDLRKRSNLMSYDPHPALNLVYCSIIYKETNKHSASVSNAWLDDRPIRLVAKVSN